MKPLLLWLQYLNTMVFCNWFSKFFWKKGLILYFSHIILVPVIPCIGFAPLQIDKMLKIVNGLLKNKYEWYSLYCNSIL